MVSEVRALSVVSCALALISCTASGRSADSRRAPPQNTPSFSVAVSPVAHLLPKPAPSPVPCYASISLDPQWRGRSTEIGDFELGFATLPADQAAPIHKTRFYEVKAPLIWGAAGILAVWVPKQERDRVALDYDLPASGAPTNPDLSTRYGIQRGYYAVAFDPCGKVRPYVFAGGLIYKGSPCVVIDFRLGSESPRETRIPILRDACSAK